MKNLQDLGLVGDGLNYITVTHCYCKQVAAFAAKSFLLKNHLDKCLCRSMSPNYS